MKIGAIIQARTSSTRLPKKVLKELPYNSGITVLEQVVQRLKLSQLINDIIIATTVNEADQKIVDIAKQINVKWYRGSENDVLERYFKAAQDNKADIIVRITSDCPCIDTSIVDLAITSLIKNKADYACNFLPRTFPRGLDVEVLTNDTLIKIHKEAKLDFERENVCPYIYKSHPDSFHIQNIEASEKLRRPDLRITLDTQEDYDLLCAIYDHLYDQNHSFSSENIINLFNNKPWLKTLNENVEHKALITNKKEEIKEAIKLLEKQGLNRAKNLLKSLS